MPHRICSQIILVGKGSIGSRYLQYISDKTQNIIVLDPKFADEEPVDRGMVRTIYKNNAQELKPSDIKPDAIAIIANWGPDHLNTVELLSSINVRKFVIEKPLTSCLNDTRKLADLAQRLQLIIAVNQGWDSIYLAQRLNRLSEQLMLGEPIGVLAYGGARCLSTAGSHVIHLANKLFSSEVIKILGSAQSARINPRNVSLAYFDGMLNVDFAEQKFLTINYSNHSAVAGEILILWKEAIGRLAEDHIEILQLDPNRDYAQIITRYADAKQVCFSGRIPDFGYPAANQFENLFYALSEGEVNQLSHLNDHLRSNKILLTALISSAINRSLTIEEAFETTLADRDFRIS